MLCVCDKVSRYFICMCAGLVTTHSHWATPVYAQSTQLPTILVDETTTDAEEETVRASTSTVSGERAEQRGVRTARDLAQLFANVSGSDSGGNRMTNYTVRGVRELGYQTSPGVMPGLAYYVDDVPALTALARASVFRNLDRISLLRGPQGSSFGFSRPGGVIDIHTAGPSDRLTAWGAFGAGNFGQLEFAAGLSTPTAINGLSITSDFVFQEREGFYNNLALGRPYGDKQSYGGRIKAQYAYGTALIDLLLQHERFDDESDPFVPLTSLSSGPFQVSYNDPGYERIGQDLQALKIRNAFEGFDFLSVTSHRYSTWGFRSDGDLTAAPLDPMNPFARLIGITDEDITTVTQEFRFKSNDQKARLKWSAGAFFAHTHMDFTAGFAAYPNTVLGCCPLREAETKSNDVAVRGELDYEIIPGLHLLPGLRYEWADRDAKNQNPAPNIRSAYDTFSAILPSMAVVVEPTENMSIYARYVRGFKPGGFLADRALTALNQFRFDEETSDNYELGFTSELVPGMFTLKGSLFYSKYRDYQVLNQISAVEFGVNNAQRVSSYGGELEAELRFGEGWRANAALGVTRATYDRFVNGFGNFSGNKVPFVPAFTANYGIAYEASWGGYISADARTIGKYALDDNNAASQKAFTLVDVTVGVKIDRFDVSLFGKNIFDEQYVINVYDFQGTGGAGAFGNIGDPATFGMRAKVRF